MSKNQHVLPKNEKWVVKSEDNKNYSKTFETQREAIEYAKTIAKKEKSELIIHGKDGKIREKNSYGNDPCPPKDQR
ncbi:MAG: DUF2188 domain-containing protein [Thermotogae bacterium]|nr:DUF2188 domain-containing protein [Thermotogota bacterium]